MAKKQLSQETDPAKALVASVVARVVVGEAPQEIIDLYKSMKPENFYFWLYGCICTSIYHKELRKTEIFKFLKEVREAN